MLNILELLGARLEESSVNPANRNSFLRLEKKLAYRLRSPLFKFLDDCEFLPLHVAEQIMRPSAKSQWAPLLNEGNKFITFACMYKKKHILGAASIAIDSSRGIPVDQSYKSHTNCFRSMGRRMAEITTLALNNRVLGDDHFHFSQNSRLAVTVMLLKSVVGYLKNSSDVDTLLMRLSRRHELIYKALLFRPLSGLEYYTQQDKEVFPAFFLDLTYLKQNPDKPVSRFLNINAPSPMKIEKIVA